MTLASLSPSRHLTVSICKRTWLNYRYTISGFFLPLEFCDFKDDLSMQNAMTPAPARLHSACMVGAGCGWQSQAVTVLGKGVDDQCYLSLATAVRAWHWVTGLRLLLPVTSLLIFEMGTQ